MDGMDGEDGEMELALPLKNPFVHKLRFTPFQKLQVSALVPPMNPFTDAHICSRLNKDVLHGRVLLPVNNNTMMHCYVLHMSCI